MWLGRLSHFLKKEEEEEGKGKEEGREVPPKKGRRGKRKGQVERTRKRGEKRDIKGGGSSCGRRVGYE